MSAGNPWPWLKLLNTGKYQAEPIFGDIYVFQCAGPKSLTCIEDFLQADLHDLKCLETRTITVPGLGIETLVQRIGMSGTLSYELRGPAQDGPAVYDAFYQVGKARYDMKRLGWRTYFVNHTEGGYPQTSCSFSQACDIDPDFIASGMNLLPPVYTGSYDPANARARLRTPARWAGAGWPNSTTTLWVAPPLRPRPQRPSAPLSPWSGTTRTWPISTIPSSATVSLTSIWSCPVRPSNPPGQCRQSPLQGGPGDRCGLGQCVQQIFPQVYLPMYHRR